jgi:GntR family transcriptional regulator/MocR family aminotransferase
MIRAEHGLYRGLFCRPVVCRFKKGGAASPSESADKKKAAATAALNVHLDMANIPIDINRSKKTALTSQIYQAIREAIESGRLEANARLPSWEDLATQLGVSRGTVRIAYQRLVDERFAVSLGAAGTHVADHPAIAPAPGLLPDAESFPGLFHDLASPPLVFQLGVPAQDAFPLKLWSGIITREARRYSASPLGYPDPRGDPNLRKEIAAYLAIARGVRCSASQVLITAGFSGALGLAMLGLQAQGKEAWIEDPGFPLTRAALALAGMTVKPMPVDADGLDVAAAIRRAAGAALAVVTPGQQAPLGMTMSLPRRLALLDWAHRNDGWIIEDDYLSELQLQGRAAPALASLDQNSRVLYISSFSKTISPNLRLGYIVVPPMLAHRFGDLTACLSPAPAPIIQRAVASFLRDGLYLRHLRHMKRLYAARRDALTSCLREMATTSLVVQATAGINLVVSLPNTESDVDVAFQALRFRLAPGPLSRWYMEQPACHGLLLSVTNVNERRLRDDCSRLIELTR